MNTRVQTTNKTTTEKRENQASNTQRPEFSPSTKSPVDQILHLQRTIGNRAVQRLIKSGALQAKLGIGQPNDRYEQEADRVADQVMRPEGSTPLKGGLNRTLGVAMPDPGLRRQPETEEEEAIQTKPLADQITPLVQRQVKPEEEEEPIPEEEEPIQTKANFSKTPAATPRLESRINSLKGGGRYLSRFTRAFFESRFGRDFGQVRVHTGVKSADVAKAMNAKAFTLGEDVVFGAGQYSPETLLGKRLIAHELAHVVQQGGATDINVTVDSNHEKHTEESLSTMKPTSFMSATPIGIQREEESSTTPTLVFNGHDSVTEIPEPPEDIATRCQLENRPGCFKHNGQFQFQDNVLTITFNPIIYRANTLHGQELTDVRGHEQRHYSDFRERAESLQQALIDNNCVDYENRWSWFLYHICTDANQFHQEVGMPPDRTCIVPSRHPRGSTTTDQWDDERAFIRVGQEYRTNIENTFLSTAVHIAIEAEQIRSLPLERERIERQANEQPIDAGMVRSILNDPDNFWLGTIIPSRYGRVLFLRRVIHDSWRLFMRQHPEGSQAFDYYREQKLQEHLRTLNRFGQAHGYPTISYTSRPTSPTPPPSFWEQFVP